MGRRLSDMSERDIQSAVEAADNRLLDKMAEGEEGDDGEEREEKSDCHGCRRRCRGSDCPLF